MFKCHSLLFIAVHGQQKAFIPISIYVKRAIKFRGRILDVALVKVTSTRNYTVSLMIRYSCEYSLLLAITRNYSYQTRNYSYQYGYLLYIRVLAILPQLLVSSNRNRYITATRNEPI